MLENRELFSHFREDGPCVNIKNDIKMCLKTAISDILVIWDRKMSSIILLPDKSTDVQD